PATSSRAAPPVPPLVESPNPCPRAPVSATAEPGRVSAPCVGVRPRASGGACLTAGEGVAFVGALPGTGSVITGVLAAGGRTGSGFLTSSGGFCAWTGRPPIDVMPPLAGPPFPPPRELVMTVLGAADRPGSHPSGATHSPPRTSPWTS